MVFTMEEEAKPKVPHDDGLTCIHCGANEASQWRGPQKRYCSKRRSARRRRRRRGTALVMRMQKQLPAGAGSKRAALGALPAQPTPR